MIFNKTPRGLRKVTREAYEFAANMMDIKPTGHPPTVVTKPGPFKVRGETVIGNYSRFKFFRWMLWERVTISTHRPEYIFANLAHEMCHVWRARRGERVTESEAEWVEAAAYKSTAKGMAN